ncbi:aminotransferase class V-fold PLP-dependent enzyme [Saccharopolyspora shandongensis]|uniref:aminotransferase class V-fold PLP-dependent enzyme n=1 Tax=Saccharopolyspora shandongensis TaxID=418495 RepID=UPI0033E6B881
MNATPAPPAETITDPELFRASFPSLAENVHLASCSQGASSRQLGDALAEFQRSMHVHGAPWEIWMDQVEQARRGFAMLIGAEPDEVAVLANASEGAFQAASTRSYAERPRIVTTDMEFPSIAHVWLAQRARGAEVVHVGAEDGQVRTEDYLDAIDERTRLVSVPLVSYRNGLLLPVREVIAQAKEQGATTFVDAYQAAGVHRIDVEELGCDFLVAGALKYVLGIPGIAFLYARRGVQDAVAPQLTGWFGRENPFAFDPRSVDHPERASRYETGTPGIPAAYGANAGLDLVNRLDATAVRDHVRGLTQRLQDALLAAGERLWSPTDPASRGPQVALLDDAPGELAAWLAERRIATSPRGTVLRMSFHFYNNESDVDTVAAAIADYRRSGR